jgi:hypothetical protein
MTDLQAQFNTALAALSNFYGDTLKAQALADRTSSSKPGAVILQVPHESRAILDEWRFMWRNAKSDEDRRQIIRDVEREYENRLRSPSRKHTFVVNTLEWKVAIGTCDLTAKDTARLYGVPLSTVYHYRKEHGRKK